MTNDRVRRSTQDRSSINSGEGYEMDYWKRQLRCTEEQLMKAVKAVGPQVDLVRSYLRSESGDGKGGVPT